MRNILAITVLMFGLAGGAMAQDHPPSPHTPLTADTPSTGNKKQHKEAPQKADCNGEKQSSATQKNPCPDCKNAQEPKASDPAPQNVIEYGG